MHTNKNIFEQLLAMSEPGMMQRQSPEVKPVEKISQNSQENIYATVFLNKIAGLRHIISLQKEALAQVFSCEFFKIFKNNFFVEHLQKTASGDKKRRVFNTISR